jgi:hypothetical protein
VLTWSEIIEANRLMVAYGELRSGALDHDAANLAGPSEHRSALRGGRLVSSPAPKHSVTACYNEETGQLSYKIS